MIFGRYSLDQFADLSLKAVNSVLRPLLDMEAVISESTDDYHVGQRFYVEVFHPSRCVFFLELSLPAKIAIVETIYNTSWSSLSRIQRDDCLLEFTRIVALKTYSYAGSSSELIKTGFPMVVFDEYEDDLEVATSDFFRVDFMLGDAPFAIVVCGNC